MGHKLHWGERPRERPHSVRENRDVTDTLPKMNLKMKEKNWRGLRGTTSGSHGPVRHIIRNGALIDQVLTPNQCQAETLRGMASQSELRVAGPLRALGFEHSVAFHGYVLDFFNEYLSICIEIDGPQHDKPARAKKDRQRDAALRARGIRTWRFKAHWARGNPISLCEYVKKLLDRMVPDR